VFCRVVLYFVERKKEKKDGSVVLDKNTEKIILRSKFWKMQVDVTIDSQIKKR
jgi:hypothetical protein